LGFTGEGKVLAVFHVTVTGATVIQQDQPLFYTPVAFLKKQAQNNDDIPIRNKELSQRSRTQPSIGCYTENDWAG